MMKTALSLVAALLVIALPNSQTRAADGDMEALAQITVSLAVIDICDLTFDQRVLNAMAGDAEAYQAVLGITPDVANELHGAMIKSVEEDGDSCAEGNPNHKVMVKTLEKYGVEVE